MKNHSHLPTSIILSRRDYAETDSHAESPYYNGMSETSPLEFWRILKQRKGTLILIGFSGAMIGFLSTLPQTPIYQARTSIEILGVDDNFLATKQVKPETADLQTHIKILQSESLLGRVLDKLKKDALPDPAGPSRLSLWRRALNMPRQG